MDNKRLQLRILDRDKGLCVRCGKMAEAVHHILPTNLFPEHKLEETNIVSVCNKCHRDIHNQYGHPTEQTIEWYIQRYYLALRILHI